MFPTAFSQLALPGKNEMASKVPPAILPMYATIVALPITETVKKIQLEHATTQHQTKQVKCYMTFLTMVKISAT